ncbi:MAG TPA: 8-amino-7-oxononanoate synthase [Verrucomicrobiae bacterium]|nr:8-amino-7-oxononanoate synthase [Verrucomicrobiae bacterium]
MNPFHEELISRLGELREQGLYRELRRLDSPQAPVVQAEGRALLNFSSNDYLGLANEPALREAAIKAVEQYGAGAGSSRLICGTLAPHAELEETLAEFKGTQAALAFSSGYAAAVGAICALVDSNDVIVVDKLVHACVVDAARLSGAKLRVFGHNNLDDLEKILQWADRRHEAPALQPTARHPRTLIVTESIFSMDGDQAPLRDLVEIKEKHGAWLMLDEAHSTGLYGATRRGLADELGVANRIEIQMGTLGKAFGSAGGYICGPRALIHLLINRARSFIFSTAPTPASAAAASAGVRFVKSDAGEQRRQQLWKNVAAVAERLGPHKIAGHTERFTKPSAIIPIMIGAENKAMKIAGQLADRGIFIPAIRFPTVSRGQARLRLTLSAAHTPDQLAQLLAAFQSVLNVGP